MIYLIVTFLFSFNLIASELKIGVVDFQLALESVNDGKKAKEKIEKEFKEKEKNYLSKESEVKILFENFQKQSLALSEKAKMDKQGEIQKKYMEVNQLREQIGQDYKKRMSEYSEPIIKSLNTIIKDLAKNKKLDLVYANQSGILYAKDDTDITNDVIKSYNEIHK